MVGFVSPQAQRLTASQLATPIRVRTLPDDVQVQSVPYQCPGVVHGTVSYVSRQGAASSMSVPGLPGQAGSVLVGRFSFVVP